MLCTGRFGGLFCLCECMLCKCVSDECTKPKGAVGAGRTGTDWGRLRLSSQTVTRNIANLVYVYIVQRAGIVSGGSRICFGEDAMMTITPLCFALCSAQILYLFD